LDTNELNPRAAALILHPVLHRKENCRVACNCGVIDWVALGVMPGYDDEILEVDPVLCELLFSIRQA
jgi:hypothetical protein